jgi:hypothetical protein
VLTFITPEIAIRVTVPEQLAPNVTVVATLPLASVVPEVGLNVAVQDAPPPLTEYVTTWPAPTGKWALKVSEPPATTVVELVEALVPGVPE